jgi:hypothetical protein
MVADTVGRPARRRLFHVQNRRKPRRCQATTVAGWTMTSVVRHLVQTREPDPEQAVGCGQAEPRPARALQHQELVPQHEHLDVQCRA